MQQPYRGGNPAPDDGDLRNELRAVMHANRELPEGLANTTIDAFIDRLDSHVDARIGAHSMIAPATTMPPSRREQRHDRQGPQSILAIGIPFVVLAGVFGHTAGVILAVLVVGAIALAQMAREALL